jgi:hypothetical protein
MQYAWLQINALARKDTVNNPRTVNDVPQYVLQAATMENVNHQILANATKDIQRIQLMLPTAYRYVRNSV